MRKIQYFIFILLFFMVIGFAAVSVSLSIGGNATVVTDIEDFKVYFSDVKLNDVQDLTLVKNDTELVFNVNLNEPGETVVVSYDVTNASKLFDASLNITCTAGNEYIGISNQFDLSNLPALSTRNGKLTLKKLKSNSNEESSRFNITCDIVATPVGRDNEASGSVIGPLPAYKYAVGNEVGIGNEKFNIISETDTAITMLAKYNLSTSYTQTEDYNYLSFSSHNGWVYTPGPKEIDVQSFDGNVKTYINEYVKYLKSLIGDENLKGDLISLTELKILGCTVEDDYSDSGGLTCSGSSNFEWLYNGTKWWTKSVSAGYSDRVWRFSADGSLYLYFYGNTAGIRPVITVSKEVLNKTIIEFTVDGETYYAYEGMTAIDWVYSAFNTKNILKTYNESNCTSHILGDAGIPYDNNLTSGYLQCTDVLTDRMNYPTTDTRVQ